MADLSFNIVALDKAGSTFIKLAEQVDKLSDKLDRLDRKDVTATVNVKTDESRRALDSFTTRWQLMATGIAAASPAIGAALVAGVGAGFIGVAAIAQSSNSEVQESYKGLWQDVVATTRNSTQQLVPFFVGAATQMSSAVHQLGPQIAEAFSAAGPSINALTRGITDAATNAMPGLVTAMQNGLPVMEGVSLAMGQLGAAGGQAFADLSQHAQALGTGIQSFGSIVSTVLGLAVDLVADLSEAWAANADSIDGAIAGVAQVISGLASGVLPVLTAALGAVSSTIQAVTSVLGPLAPALGFVGGAALATWAAFKLADVVSVGVKRLALGVVTLGGNMEGAAVKSAGMIAGMRGVSVAASTTATTVAAAGRATATAAVTMGASLAAIAGPLGIVLTAGAVLWSLFASSTDEASTSAVDAATGIDTVTAALQRSHGAVDQSVRDSVKSLAGYSEVARITGAVGVTQTELTNAIMKGGSALDAIKAPLQAYAKGLDTSTIEGRAQMTAIDGTMAKLDDLASMYGKGTASADANSAASHRVAEATVANDRYWSAAAGTANALGISLGSVSGGYTNIVATGSAASNAVQDVSAAFINSALGVAQASQAISDHFQSADKAVSQAQQGLADANHSAEASSRSVADATHSLANARRSLSDATQGVATAQGALTKAQEQEKEAQAALHTAREQAIRDLKELHLQLADQQVTEQQARVRLFDATKDAAGFGVTKENVHTVANQDVTDENESQVKAALDLLSAQNALNNALNSGQKLREDVADADKSGVDGAKGVVSAQKAVKSAHEQVISAQTGLAKAQQQVADSAYGVQRAQQAVSDAEYQRARASDRVSQAQQTLADAQGAASRSLDIHTKAGQENLKMLMTLWAAIGATGMPVQQQFQAMIDNTARVMGLSTTAAQQYLTNLGLIPKDFKYSVTAVAGADLTAITKTTINGVEIFQSGLGKGGVASAGRLATGGPVIGPGGPRDDLVPLWGSHGEFMQPADSVSHYGLGFMEAVRKKRLRVVGGDGAAIPGFKDGGLLGTVIGAMAAYTNLSTAYVTDVNALTVMGLKHPPQLPKYVPPPVVAPMLGGAAGVPNKGGSYRAGSGVAQWTGLVLQVLAELGQPSSLLPNVLRRMNQESGGNPNAINNWDSNAKKGTPSIGLMQCVPLDSEILTRRGWLRHDQVEIGDETLGYNPATGCSEWTRITKIVHYEDAPVIRIGNKHWSARVTPNHRWWSDTMVDERESFDSCPECGWKSRAKKTPSRGVQVHRMKMHGAANTPTRRSLLRGEFVRSDTFRNTHRLRVAAPAATDRGIDLLPDEVRIVAWIVGDGHITKDGDATIYQSKPDMVVLLRALLADVPHTEDVRHRNTRHLPAHAFRLRRAFGRELWKRSRIDELGPEAFVLALDAAQRHAFLDAMIQAEGHTADNFTRIAQVNGPVQDAIKLAVFLEGYRPTYSANSAERNGYQPAGTIGMARPHVAPAMFDEPQDTGVETVWCVKTDLETWTMRQDGQIMLTGNTIGPTFNRWAGPYVGRGIYDPLANIYAGINYAIHRYPSLQYAMDKPGGYKRGGWLMPGQLAYNETSTPEPVLSSEQWDALINSRRGGDRHYHLTAVTQAHQIDLGAKFALLEAMS